MAQTVWISPRHRSTGARTPGFPVKFGGLDALHAALLNESRTRGRLLVPRTGNPGISLVFREMWDTTVLHPEPLVASKS